MRPLKVDSFTGGIGSDENFHIFILGKSLLGVLPLFASQASVDNNNCFRSSEE